MRVPCLAAVFLLTTCAGQSSSLEELVRSGVLSPQQAAQILQEATTTEDYSILGLVPASLLLTILGCVALAVFYHLALAWASTRGRVLTAVVSGCFGMVFYGAGLSLAFQSSGLLASVLLLCSYKAWMDFTFTALAAVGIASEFSESLDGLHPVHVGTSFVLGYTIARSCSFVLAQIPFFFSLYAAAELAGKRLASTQARVHAMKASCGGFLLLYTYAVGARAFAPSDDYTDFQVLAYLTGALLFCQGSTDLTKGAEEEGVRGLHWVRLLLSLAVLFLGFRASCSVLIFFGMRWLSEELSTIAATESLFPSALVVTPLLYLFLIANFSLQLINDIFTPQAKRFLADSYLWSIACYVLTVGCSFFALLFALGITNVKVLADTAEDKPPQVLWQRAVYNFVMCYAATLLLIVLAENEASWVVSLGYLVFAVVTYIKVIGLLFVSELNETILTVVFLSGQRITLVGSSFWTCCLIGGVLMGVGLVFLSFRARNSRAIFALSLALEVCLLSTSLIARSCLLFSASVCVGVQVLSARLSPQHMGMTISVSVAVLALYLAQSWDVEALTQSLSRTSILKRVLAAAGDPTAIVPEKEVARRIFSAVRDWLLDLSTAA